ncbi:MAG: glycosyltransferase family 2 protein [Phycisphaeraceae bacterium]
MKLVIQIPCYNEEQSLPAALAALPRDLPGFDRVEWLVVNDGSTDRTVEVAEAHGVDHVVSFPANRGLSAAFLAGLDAAVKRGADVIVNTDADNQYRADDIPALVEPILAGRAEIVVGARPIDATAHFSTTKKLLQKLGSKVVRMASHTHVVDSPSGFRAISRDAAMQLNVFNRYTYTLETIIQAGQKGIPITSVPVHTNGPTRPSRLVKSVRSYVLRSMVTIFRIFMVYRPLALFLWLGLPPVMAGGILFLRWLLLAWIEAPPHGRIPSLIAATVLVLLGFHLWFFGLLADLLAANRKLLEDCQVRLRRFDADAASHAHARTAPPPLHDAGHPTHDGHAGHDGQAGLDDHRPHDDRTGPEPARR